MLYAFLSLVTAAAQVHSGGTTTPPGSTLKLVPAGRMLIMGSSAFSAQRFS